MNFIMAIMEMCRGFPMTREEYSLPKNFVIIDNCICTQVVTPYNDDSETEPFTESDLYSWDWTYGKLLQ